MRKIIKALANFRKKSIELILSNWIVLVLGIILFLLEIINLDQIFLLRGERDIALTGYSLAKTGKDLYGNLLPLNFSGLDMPTPFLSFYFSAISWLILPVTSVFFARLPFVLLSIITFFLIYKLFLDITKVKSISLLTAIIFCFNPGSYHLLRLSLEIGLAIPLFIAAMLCFLRGKYVVSYLLFFLVFFTYNGFRPIIPLFLIYLAFFHFLQKKNKKNFILQASVGTILFLILFIISSLYIDGEMMRSRKSDLIFVGYGNLSQKVDFRRSTAIGPEVLKPLLNNKITATLYYIVEVFVGGLDLQYLFLKGDPSILYGTTFSGQFFIVFLPFFFLGFLFLGKKWNNAYFYPLGFIPLALVSSLVNVSYISYSIRAMPATIVFAYIISCGIYFYISHFFHKGWFFSRILPSVFVFFLTIELIFFSYNYFFRRPKTMGEIFFKSEKNIALFLTQTKQKYTIYDDSPKNIFENYVFFSTNPNMNDVHKQMKRNNDFFVLGKSTISKCKQDVPINSKYIIFSDSCLSEKQYEVLNNSPIIQKIPYEDFSLRTAYFIINNNISQ